MIEKCTAIIKTFLRDDYFFECYRSLKKTYPKLKVLVADSGDDTEEKTKFIKDNKIEYYKLPFDSGICVGRNYLIEKVKTPYILVGDDDFQYSDTAMVGRMVKFLEDNPEYDLIGGRIFENGTIRNYQGFIKQDGKTLIYDRLDLENMETDKRGFQYKECDLTFNFFVARTEPVRKTKWDENIKVRYEHSAFFIDFRNNGYRVAFSPEPIVVHKPNITIKTNRREYVYYRGRIDDRIAFFKKFGIEKIIDMDKRIDIFEDSSYSDIVFLINTFDRKKALERLLFSIAKYYPSANILIADDGKMFDVEYYLDLWKRLADNGLIKKPTAYNVEFDKGISFKRNFLCKIAKEKEYRYYLFLDDDFEFTEDTEIKKMRNILRFDWHIGVVGGKVLDDGKQERHFEHNFDLRGENLYFIKDESEKKIIEDYSFTTPDCVLNFFLAPAEVFNDIKWDNRIKIQGEHTDFFWRLKKTKWKVAYCPDVKINHIHETNDEYKAFRKREEFLIKMMNGNGFKKMVYLDGFTYEIKDDELLKYNIKRL